jgi:hypothetical protein
MMLSINFKREQRLSCVGVAAMALAGPSACTDEDVFLPRPIGTPDASAGPSDADEPLYLIQTRVFSPDGTTAVLIPTPTLRCATSSARPPA